ncbi:hypothetical protein TNCT_443521 [Trichonephila clavata]|uniref:Uncharacterized protein n=1 Tax=Trichonephila clavata TaxID=2740835 RepID=A0A8X6GEX8_TRICU|nr:hypothetical protein TNCT_443521 [Trichonephila clavata]
MVKFLPHFETAFLDYQLNRNVSYTCSKKLKNMPKWAEAASTGLTYMLAIGFQYPLSANVKIGDNSHFEGKEGWPPRRSIINDGWEKSAEKALLSSLAEDPFAHSGSFKSLLCIGLGVEEKALKEALSSYAIIWDSGGEADWMNNNMKGMLNIRAIMVESEPYLR